MNINLNINFLTAGKDLHITFSRELGFLMLSLFAFSSCLKIEREAKVETIGILEVTATSVKPSGEIIDIGEGILSYGHILYDQGKEILSHSAVNSSVISGVYTTVITGLNPNTTYYVSAYAVTINGTIYGDLINFTTTGYPPEVAFSASSTTITSVQSIQFFDQSTNNPTEWQWNFGDGEKSSEQNPFHTYTTAGTYTVSLTASNNFGSDTEIKPYYITVNIIKANNWFPAISPIMLGKELSVATDIINSGDVSFSFVLTAEIYDVNTQIAFIGQKTTALIQPGYSEEIIFKYLIPLDWEAKNYRFRIVVWSSIPFSSTILDEDNEVFTVVSNPLTVTDADGNVYSAVSLGPQVWLGENLKTTRYNDGSSIPSATGTADWSNLTTPGYCWYENNATTYESVYGALYNWYAVNTGRLCPSGWHVASDNDWTTLTNYLQGESVAGGKLKATGTLEGGDGLWHSPNTEATNEEGFTALPGGYRADNGLFEGIGLYGNWWTSSEASSLNAWTRGLDYDLPYCYRYNGHSKKDGYSVRCIKD